MGTTTDKEKLKQYRENERKKREWAKLNDPVEWERLRQLKKNQEQRRKERNPELFKENTTKRSSKYALRHPFKVLCTKFKCRRTYGKIDFTPFDLWKLAKKQRLICALTGDKLTRKNISLDHIIPRSRGGSNHIENLRFVTTQSNRSKMTMLDSEFLTLCEKIIIKLKKVHPSEK